MEITHRYIGKPQNKPNHIQNPADLLVKLMEVEHEKGNEQNLYNGKIAVLEHKIRELERDNSILLDLLAQVMRENNSIVLREENFGRKHKFKIDENPAGEPLLIVVC